MASEIHFDHTTGRTCYVSIRNAIGQIYNTAGAAFEAYNAANYADYDIAATEQGASGLYAASMPAINPGAYSIVAKERAGGAPAESDVSVGVGDILWNGSVVVDFQLYHCDIQLTIDTTNSQDEYTITFFKNGIRQTSGITSPVIQVVKRADGTDLIASTALTQIGSTGSYKKDATTTQRTTAGEAVLAIVTATIDGGSRSFSRLVGRDST